MLKTQRQITVFTVMVAENNMNAKIKRLLSTMMLLEGKHMHIRCTKCIQYIRCACTIACNALIMNNYRAKPFRGQDHWPNTSFEGASLIWSFPVTQVN